MIRVLNAFEVVRPKAAVAPSAAPQERPRGREPELLPGSLVRDCRGKLCVPLEPSGHGSIVIEGRVQGQASTDKRRALAKGGI